jgi:hypothetical protein
LSFVYTTPGLCCAIQWVQTSPLWCLPTCVCGDVHTHVCRWVRMVCVCTHAHLHMWRYACMNRHISIVLCVNSWTHIRVDIHMLPECAVTITLRTRETQWTMTQTIEAEIEWQEQKGKGQNVYIRTYLDFKFHKEKNNRLEKLERSRHNTRKMYTHTRNNHYSLQEWTTPTATPLQVYISKEDKIQRLTIVCVCVCVCVPSLVSIAIILNVHVQCTVPWCPYNSPTVTSPNTLPYV